MQGLLPDNIRLSSVKIEALRVEMLIQTLREALFGTSVKETPDLSACLSRSRQIQVRSMRTS
jgi:hypothetical protein